MIEPFIWEKKKQNSEDLINSKHVMDILQSYATIEIEKSIHDYTTKKISEFTLQIAEHVKKGHASVWLWILRKGSKHIIQTQRARCFNWQGM